MSVEAGKNPDTFTLPPLKTRLVGGGIWAFAGKAVVLGAGLVNSALLTRILEPDAVGAYFLAVTVVTVAAMVGVIGLDKSVLQHVAESLARGWQGRARRVVSKSFLLGALATALTVTVMWSGAGSWLATEVFDSAGLAGIVGLVGVWVAVLANEKLLGETFRGFHDIPGATLFGGTVNKMLIAAFLAVLWIVAEQATLDTVVSLVIAAGATSGVAGWIVLRRKLARLGGSGGRAEPAREGRPAAPGSGVPGEALEETVAGAPAAAAEPGGGTAAHRPGQRSAADAAEPGGDGPSLAVTALLVGALPLLVAAVTQYALAQAGFWIIGGYLEEADVALFGTAMRAATLVAISLAIANKVLPPIIGEFYAQEKRERLQRLLRMATGVVMLPSLVLFAAFVFFGGPILSLVFGEFYGAGATVLAILAVGQLMNVWVGPAGYTLIMSGHQRDLMWISMFTATVAIVGGLLVVRPFGIEGVAAATTGAVSLQQVLMLTGARIRCGIWTHASFSRLPEAFRLLRGKPVRA